MLSLHWWVELALGNQSCMLHASTDWPLLSSPPPPALVPLILSLLWVGSITDSLVDCHSGLAWVFHPILTTLPCPSLQRGSTDPLADLIAAAAARKRGRGQHSALATKLLKECAIDHKDVMFCRGPDGNLVQLGAGAYGQVRV